MMRFSLVSPIHSLVILFLTLIPLDVTAGLSPDSALVPKADLMYLVNGRRPIWMGPFIRYTVFQKTTVEARFYALGGEMIHVLRVGDQQPGQYTLPFDGTMENGAIQFEGKYYFELFFGDEFATTFWFICKQYSSDSTETQE